MTGPLESPLLALWGGMTRDYGDVGDRRALRATLPRYPSTRIPKHLAHIIPKASQIANHPTCQPKPLQSNELT
jgi:hypothetical protein